MLPLSVAKCVLLVVLLLEIKGKKVCTKIDEREHL